MSRRILGLIWDQSFTLPLKQNKAKQNAQPPSIVAAILVSEEHINTKKSKQYIVSKCKNQVFRLLKSIRLLPWRVVQAFSTSACLWAGLPSDYIPKSQCSVDQNLPSLSWSQSIGLSSGWWSPRFLLMRNGIKVQDLGATTEGFCFLASSADKPGCVCGEIYINIYIHKHTYVYTCTFQSTCTYI